MPFAENAEDPYEIYEEIISKPVKFPIFVRDDKVKKFIINKLLNKIPEARLGGSFTSLKADEYF